MATSIKIKNGIYDLLLSGSFIAKASDPTVLTLKGDGELELLKFIFKFENEDKDPNTPRKTTKVIDNTSLEITFINYNNILGTFTTNLWEIGSLNNRKLYLAYFICGLTVAKSKKVDYSFYLGEEVANG
jgi:hypothetical protein